MGKLNPKNLLKFLKVSGKEASPLIEELGEAGAKLPKELDIDVSGNAKGGFLSFDLPPYLTCPGKDCGRFPCIGCYGKAGMNLMHKEDARQLAEGFFAKQNLLRNLTQTKDPRFTEELVKTIMRSKSDLPVRPHAVGDFYSQGYLNKWIEAAKALPAKDFYAYTKSYPILDFEELMKQPNFGILQSMGAKADRATIDPNFAIATAVPERFKMPAGWLDASETDYPAMLAALSKSPQRVGLRQKVHNTSLFRNRPDIAKKLDEDFEFVVEGDKLIGNKPRDMKDALRENLDQRKKIITGNIDDILEGVDPESPLARFIKRQMG